jgi:hypothetical protein
MKDLIEADIPIILILLLFLACVGAAVTLSQNIQQQARESKPTLNLCSAETIRIGEDIEYVYVKVKK